MIELNLHLVLNENVFNILIMTEDKKKEIQSATFERLLKHLDERKDVQNIDLMNLANFCRNCLSRWYREEAEKKGISISDPEARELCLRHALLRMERKISKIIIFL